MTELEVAYLSTTRELDDILSEILGTTLEKHEVDEYVLGELFSSVCAPWLTPVRLHPRQDKVGKLDTESIGTIKDLKMILDTLLEDGSAAFPGRLEYVCSHSPVPCP